jgi:predicted ATPase
MLKSIRICNFKSLRDVTVEFDPLTVLIGPSGTGKTNFLHAIRFLRKCLKDSTTAAEAFGGWDKILPFGENRPERVMMEATLRLANAARDLSYRFEVGSGAGPVISEVLATTERTIFSRRGDVWTQLPPDLQGEFDRDKLALGQRLGANEAREAFTCLSKGVGCYQFDENVLRRQNKGTVNGLSDTAENYLDILRKISQADLLEITAAAQVLDPTAERVSLRSPARDALEVHHRWGKSICAVGVADESEGLRRLLAHLIALYQQPPKSIVAFDEPEKGIYPRGLAVLAEEFLAFSNSARSQIILASHSPQLLDDLPIDSVRVFEMVDGATKIGRVAREQFDAVRENLLSPGELLTVDEARRDQPASAAP